MILVKSAPRRGANGFVGVQDWDPWLQSFVNVATISLEHWSTKKAKPQATMHWWLSIVLFRLDKNMLNVHISNTWSNPLPHLSLDQSQGISKWDKVAAPVSIPIPFTKKNWAFCLDGVSSLINLTNNEMVYSTRWYLTHIHKSIRLS